MIFGFHFVKFGIFESSNCNEIIIFTKNIAISAQNVIDVQKLVVIRFVSTIHRFLPEKSTTIHSDLTDIVKTVHFRLFFCNLLLLFDSPGKFITMLLFLEY